MSALLQTGVEDGMPRIWSCRICQFLSYVLAVSFVVFLLLRLELQVPGSQSGVSTIPPQFDKFPVYEYQSVYRAEADPGVEEALDSQLLAIERSARSSLLNGFRSLIANHTIWQIASSQDAKDWHAWISRWSEVNPEWSHRTFAAPSPTFMHLFSNITDIGSTIGDSVIGHDLLKYLLLWYHGGIFADINTWNRVALRNCLPIRSALMGKANISMLVGVDSDESYLSQKTMQSWGWTRGFGFGTTVLWAPRRFDPIMRKAIVRTISHGKIQNLLDGGRKRDETRSHMKSEISGSGMLTDIVLEALSNSLDSDDPLRDRDAGLRSRVTWKKFRWLKNTIWIEQDSSDDDLEAEVRGLAILPMDIWVRGQHPAENTQPTEACINPVHDWRENHGT